MSIYSIHLASLWALTNETSTCCVLSESRRDGTHRDTDIIGITFGPNATHESLQRELVALRPGLCS